MMKKKFINKHKNKTSQIKKQQPNISENKVKLQHEAEVIVQKQDNNQKIKKKKSSKKNRMIVRNLVFDINQKHIRKLFAPYGQIVEVQIPKHPDRNCSKGFAFVELAKYNYCVKAIKDLNGSLFKGRNIVLDFSVPRENYLTEKLKEEQESQNEDQEVKEEGMVKQQIDENLMDQEGQDDDDDDDDQEDDQEDKEQQKQSNQILEDHKSQIFIRNLPISLTQEFLFKKFRKFGKINFVKIVKNKQTDTSKGTAFIKFYNPSVADNLIQYSRNYQMYLLKKNRKFTPNPEINLNFDGSIIKIFPVETRQGIQNKLKKRDQGVTEQKVKPLKKIKKIQDLIKIDKYGKRKLQLGLLGSWRAQQGMNKYDYQKFKSHEKQKINKLKNPNNSISPTRLILKHIDKQITQDSLKKLCQNYLQQNQLNVSHLSYCKLMMDSSMKKSAGFAFIEFKKHEESKAFLEDICENPGKLMNKLFIAEFAIQDSRKMLKLSNSKKIKKVLPQNNKKQKQRKPKKIINKKK